ncbi:hypothetical protein ACP70R_039081 [Stipagrostis hirtigluma subsp. patula]
MSGCCGNCGCGAGCKCGNGCCEMYPEVEPTGSGTATFLADATRSEMAAAEHGGCGCNTCKCGTSCGCSCCACN